MNNSSTSKKMTGIKNNTIVEDQLISFETAKLAKEKGFNEVSSACFDINGKSHFGINHKNDLGGSVYSSPSQSLLQKWLREKHKLHVKIDDWELSKWYFSLVDGRELPTKKITLREKPFEFSSYEDALERGLEEALKLIETQIKS